MTRQTPHAPTGSRTLLSTPSDEAAGLRTGRSAAPHGKRSGHTRPAATQPITGESGFTLLELLVTVVIVAMVMVVVLTTFDMNSKLTMVQEDVADVQQNVRIGQRDMAHLVRMAGRGGLPRPNAVLVDQNVAVSTTLAGETVLPETDVLTLRGVLESPIYRIDAGDEATFTNNGTTATLLIDSVTKSGFDQPLGSLQDLVGDGGAVDPEPIVLVSRQSDFIYAVVELGDITFANITLPTGVEVERATLTLNIADGGSGHAADYLALSSTPGAFPPNLTSVLFAGVLEEYRYFIRQEYSVPGDATSSLSPKLSRVRMIPGTDTIHPDPGQAVDVSDHIFDLQVALGIDLDADGIVDVEDADGNPLEANLDEWRYNATGEDDTLAWDTSPLLRVRLNILGQTRRADIQYIAPAIASIEDREYNELSAPTGGQLASRRYRRRLLQGDVDLRNL